MHSRYDRVVVEQAAIAGALRPSVAGNPAEAEVVDQGLVEHRDLAHAA
jgi:DNA gyrase subunit B